MLSAEVGKAVPIVDALDGFGARLAQALRGLGLSQIEAARRLGVSISFLNDVIRERKRPGAELLAALRRELRVSIDWLVTGNGGEIRLDLLRAAQLQHAIVQAAENDGNPVAKMLLDRVVHATSWSVTSAQEIEFVELLTRSSEKSGEQDLAVAVYIYNEHLHEPDPVVQRRGMALTAVKLNRLRRHSDPILGFVES